ncbi:MAG: hypothetical protein FWD71_00845 [Oscillospiraceae bacterium]|nr:hypothetical protein [Oscillospiraceae bacterium]
MLSLNQDSALVTIYNYLNQREIIWVLTGSTSFTIQGMKLTPRDIDIQTNKAGAYEINELLKNYVVRPVLFSAIEKVRSHIGYFAINGVEIEVMGDIQKKCNDIWEDIIDLRPFIEQIVYKNMKLPVLNLSYESSAYRKLGRFERADEIDNFLYSKRTE